MGNRATPEDIVLKLSQVEVNDPDGGARFWAARHPRKLDLPGHTKTHGTDGNVFGDLGVKILARSPRQISGQTFAIPAGIGREQSAWPERPRPDYLAEPGAAAFATSKNLT